MPFLRSMSAVLVGLTVTFAGVAVADVPPGLDGAIKSGNTTAIGAIIAANKSNPAVLAEIANALLAAAVAVKATNPSLAALLAAEAVTTGALSDADQLAALEIVGANPQALALLGTTNGNSAFGLSGGNRSVGGSENGRTGESQRSGSRN